MSGFCPVADKSSRHPRKTEISLIDSYHYKVDEWLAPCLFVCRWVPWMASVTDTGAFVVKVPERKWRVCLVIVHVLYKKGYIAFNDLGKDTER